MKIYLNQNVFDAALERIRWLFDEFPNVVVGFSGGKDSTVVLNLALQVAEERGRLPLKVMFVDQEAEWQCVIDYVRRVMHDPRVEPCWLQVPIILYNATSTDDPWLECWANGQEWMRDREDISIKENVYGTNRFKPMAEAFLKHTFPKQKACNLSGVRCEESPARFIGLTGAITYKWATWGNALDKKVGQYIFHPLYDWSFTDIWAAIHQKGWDYCKLYDYQYQYGVPVRSMRVSNVHHETAVEALYYLQEIEADTWRRLTKRLRGINTAGTMKKDAFMVTSLPFMFDNWKEYRDYLLEHMITDPKVKGIMLKTFAKNDIDYAEMNDMTYLIKEQIKTILTNDYELTRLLTALQRPEYKSFRKHIAGVSDNRGTKYGKYIKKDVEYVQRNPQ